MRRPQALKTIARNGSVIGHFIGAHVVGGAGNRFSIIENSTGEMASETTDATVAELGEAVAAAPYRAPPQAQALDIKPRNCFAASGTFVRRAPDLAKWRRP